MVTTRKFAFSRSKSKKKTLIEIFEDDASPARKTVTVILKKPKRRFKSSSE